MKKLSGIIGLFSLLSTTLALAASPISIINNTNMKMDLQYYYCNDKGKCTFVNNLHLDNKGSATNVLNLLYPAGMDNIHLSSAKIYDKDNNVVATLQNDCHATAAASNAIIVDSYGTNKLFCLYSNV